MIDVLLTLILMLGWGEDPTRYCYTVNDGQPWSCYLEADRPQGHDPVWVGPQSRVAEAML